MIAGASEPDWGPADVPAARANPGSGPATGKPGAALKVKVKRTTLKSALRKGVRVRVTVPKAGRLGATARSQGRVVAKAPSRRVKAGTRTLTLRFTAKARRALRRGGAAKLSIRVAWTPTGGASKTTTLRTTLKRG